MRQYPLKGIGFVQADDRGEQDPEGKIFTSYGADFLKNVSHRNDLA